MFDRVPADVLLRRRHRAAVPATLRYNTMSSGTDILNLVSKTAAAVAGQRDIAWVDWRQRWACDNSEVPQNFLRTQWLELRCLFERNASLCNGSAPNLLRDDHGPSLIAYGELLAAVVGHAVFCESRCCLLIWIWC